MKTLLSYLMIFLVIFASSCKPKPKAKDNFEPVFSTYKPDSTETKKKAVKNEIFYGVLTPVEISTIFERLNVPYDVPSLNPAKNKDQYMSSSKVSINTGIYVVDMGFFKMFGIGQGMIDYMVTIREMSDKLGIPESYLTEPINKIQKDISDPDTIMYLMNSAYGKMDKYLRSNGKESSAGLMIMGGWVEAMYIATQLVYDPANPDPEVMQKIAEQKYTLTALLTFLNNYYDDPVVVSYVKKLKFLKTYFDSFEVFFNKDDLKIDTAKKVLLTSNSKTNATVATLNQIRDYINTLRTEMVTP
jgi:hypothetical protein